MSLDTRTGHQEVEDMIAELDTLGDSEEDDERELALLRDIYDYVRPLYEPRA